MDIKIWWVWIIVTAIFLIFRIFSRRSFLLWFGIGSGAACILSILDFGLSWQIISFIVLPLVFFAISKRFTEKPAEKQTQGIGSDAHWRLAQRYGKKPSLIPINETLVQLLATVFSEEEADFVSTFPMLPANAARIAKRAGISRERAESLLSDMDKRAVIFSYLSKGERKYSLMAVIPGIFELTMMAGKKDAKYEKFARLFESYYTKDYLEPYKDKVEGMAKIIPVEKHIPDRTGVLPTDRVSELIYSHKSFALTICSCRHSRELVGRGCGLPKDVCMIFGLLADFVVNRGLARRAEKQEMIDAAKRAEEAGLVHLADNIEQANFLCSCCACCCGALRIITEFNFPRMIANSHFIAQVDLSKCDNCGKCIRRCPSGALSIFNKRLIFKDWKCIGCGLCISSCDKNYALSLAERPDYKPPHESIGHFAVDLGFQSIGMKRILDERFPGVYRRLKGGLSNKINKKIPQDN